MKNVLVVAILLLSFCTYKSSTKFNYKISGSGAPTIVICQAMGEVRTTWDTLQTRLSQKTTVVTYDRLGLGKSDSTSKPRTIDNLSNELNEFLTTQNVPGPYLLIGHSLGTSIIRRYQNDHPENVVGMILIDPMHEDQFERLMAIKSPNEREKTLSEREEFLSSLKPGELNEAIQYHQQRRAMKDVRYPTSIPITILGSFQVGNGVTKEERQIKMELYQAWVSQAPQLKLVVTTKSGHYIQDSEPELLVTELGLMLAEVKSKLK